MKSGFSNKSAFTLIELLVLLAVISILGSLLLPAMARSNVKSSSAVCQNNLRQMMVGWDLYESENNGILMPNGPVGTPLNESWCNSASEDLNAATDANTNAVKEANALLAHYLSGQIRVYRCPGDTVPSPNGLRIRSYSMNGAMGQWYLTAGGTHPGLTHGNGLRTYNKITDLTCPNPGMAFIFCDENAESIDDGWLQIGSSGSFPDVPAAYHNLGGSFAFADGHAEIHKWTITALTTPPVTPVWHGLTAHNLFTSPTNDDWQWFAQRAACSN